MALFGLFGRKPKGYASPWLQLTVVCATAGEGLEPDDAFALRGEVIAAHPIDFEFKPPGCAGKTRTSFQHLLITVNPKEAPWTGACAKVFIQALA